MMIFLRRKRRTFRMKTVTTTNREHLDSHKLPLVPLWFWVYSSVCGSSIDSWQQTHSINRQIIFQLQPLQIWLNQRTRAQRKIIFALKSIKQNRYDSSNVLRLINKCWNKKNITWTEWMAWFRTFFAAFNRYKAAVCEPAWGQNCEWVHARWRTPSLGFRKCLSIFWDASCSYSFSVCCTW